MGTDFRKKTQISIEKMKSFPGYIGQKIWKVGRDDPRRLIYAFKVGFSLTLVSLLYLIEPLFKGVGQNAIWAVMTVVVVLEFTAGATICKGLNRGFGTFLAAVMAMLFEFLAREYGKVFRAVFIGASIFVIGASTTFLRFFPKIKKNYDYGVLIFLLTFNLITVSSYRVDDILKLARGRIYAIAIGSGVCILMTLFILPNWSGEDLHNSTVSKIEGLAKSVEACVNKYFTVEESDTEIGVITDDPIYKNYKAVLDSKSTDETLARHASWEPRHSVHCHKFPCQQYVKLGGVLRHFGYGVVALHGSLQTELRTPRSVRLLFKEPCIRLGSEVTKALSELAASIRNRRHCSPEILTENLQQALLDLNTALKSQPRLLLGPNNPNNTSKMLALAAATGRQRAEHHTSNLKPDSSTSFDQKSKDSPTAFKDSPSAFDRKSKDSPTAFDQKSKDSPTAFDRKSKGGAEARVLRPTLSKLTITSLEFSEALPFAAFVALLVELVARLDLVIEEVEELGRVACFKEFKPDEVIVDVETRTPKINLPFAATE